jgi:hypothetical protein
MGDLALQTGVTELIERRLTQAVKEIKLDIHAANGQVSGVLMRGSLAASCTS